MRRFAAVLLVLLCSGVACTGAQMSRYRYYLAKERVGQPPPARWLVTSMNLDLELPQDLVEPAATLHGELLDYLKKSGCQASAVPFSELRQRLGKVIAADSQASEPNGIGGVEQRERALGLLARDLARNASSR